MHLLWFNLTLAAKQHRAACSLPTQWDGGENWGGEVKLVD